MALHASPLIRGFILIASIFAPTLAAAQPGDCHLIADNMERLACYDSTAPRSALRATPGVKEALSETPAVKDRMATATPVDQFAPREPERERERTQSAFLNESWELEPESKRGVFEIRPYKTLYIMPFSFTNNINKAPSSDAEGRTASPQEGLSRAEAKFQFSLKTKVLENLIGDNGDLWLGYTQSSRWQVYNKQLSRPFRETNYEPEAMLIFRTNYEILGFKGTMAGVGVNHQSNGRAEPLSRSWNRVIAQAGFERDDWMVILRPWWRMPENGGADDNPGIENYMGRGDMTVARKWHDQVFSLKARHSLRGGENSRGSAQLAWSFPLTGDLKGYMQLFSGYGESMIDFNVKQTAIGLGFSMLDIY
jgi:phospholipase A1